MITVLLVRSKVSYLNFRFPFEFINFPIFIISLLDESSIEVGTTDNQIPKNNYPQPTVMSKYNEKNNIIKVFKRKLMFPSFVLQVKVAALQCLVKIMSLYYQYMEAYMGQVN